MKYRSLAYQVRIFLCCKWICCCLTSVYMMIYTYIYIKIWVIRYPTVCLMISMPIETHICELILNWRNIDIDHPNYSISKIYIERDNLVNDNGYRYFIIHEILGHTAESIFIDRWNDLKYCTAFYPRIYHWQTPKFCQFRIQCIKWSWWSSKDSPVLSFRQAPKTSFSTANFALPKSFIISEDWCVGRIHVHSTRYLRSVHGLISASCSKRKHWRSGRIISRHMPR